MLDNHKYCFLFVYTFRLQQSVNFFSLNCTAIMLIQRSGGKFMLRFNLSIIQSPRCETKTGLEASMFVELERKELLLLIPDLFVCSLTLTLSAFEVN